MELNLNGRELYELQIDTTTTTGDPVPRDGWEASFDGGTSWWPAQVITHDEDPGTGDKTWSTWLLAGSEAEVGDAVAVIRRSMKPIVRAIDNPEIIARTAPGVNVR